MSGPDMAGKRTDRGNLRPWRTALPFAAPIAAGVLCLIYAWFALADRYLIFLYFHDMGPGFDTTPFGWVTGSRYWMSGLVAGGAVMVAYHALNLVLGRVLRSYRAPDWRRVWALCAVPLTIGIPAIVMTVNDPVLPLANALQVTGATLAGLGLALVLGRVAAERPIAYGWLMFDGFGLAILLAALPSFEDYPRWLAAAGGGSPRGRAYLVMHLLAICASIGWLIMVTALRWWRDADVPRVGNWLAAGLDIAYLFLPLIHHLFFSTDEGSWTDPGYFRYIPDADNYFARSMLLQLGVWAVVALIGLGVTQLRQRLSEWRAASRAQRYRVDRSVRKEPCP